MIVKNCTDVPVTLIDSSILAAGEERDAGINWGGAVAAGKTLYYKIMAGTEAAEIYEVGS
jgi:hypothetical protein